MMLCINIFSALLLPLAAGSKLISSSETTAGKVLVQPGRLKTSRLRSVARSISPPAAAFKDNRNPAAAAADRSLTSTGPSEQSKLQPVATSKDRGTSLALVDKSLTPLEHSQMPRPQTQAESVGHSVSGSMLGSIFEAAARKFNALLWQLTPSTFQAAGQTAADHYARAFVQRSTAHSRMRLGSRRPTIMHQRHREREPRGAEDMDKLWGVPKIVWVILADVVAMATFLGCIPFIMHMAKRRRPEMGNPGTQGGCCPCLQPSQKQPAMQGHPGMYNPHPGGYAMGGGGHGGYAPSGGGHGGYAPPPRGGDDGYVPRGGGYGGYAPPPRPY